MKDWFLLFRPWSYTATLVPFLLGGAFATGCNPECLVHPWLRWGLGLLSGLFFQATVNLLNTWGDERSGVDAMPGAIRTTPQVHEGKVSMRALFTVAASCLVCAVAVGLALCFYEIPAWCYRACPEPPAGPEWAFCWTLIGAGVLGALGSVNYSTGVKFKYHGLGVPFVSFLMGPLEILVAFAVAAPWMADRLMGRLLFVAFAGFPSFTLGALGGLCFLLVPAAPVALLVGVIMHGNDMRDIPTDRAAGIVTFASWLGPRRALAYYCFCHVVPYVLVAAFGCFGPFRRAMFLLLPCLALPLSVRTMCAACRVYRENPESPKWRGLERASGKVHLVFGVLYALAWFLFLSSR